MKWGEYSSDVQFILQRSEQQQQKVDPKQSGKADDISTSTLPATTSAAISIQPLDRHKENRKSFGSHDSKPPENVGIVKGIPQILPTLHQYHQSPPASSSSSSPTPQPQSHHSPNNSIASQHENPISKATAPKSNEFNSADVRNSLERKTNLFGDNSSNESLIDVYSTRNSHELYKTGPPISSNGALVPPPYRDPPPPRVSPLHQKSDSFSKMFEYKVNNFFLDFVRLFAHSKILKNKLTQFSLSFQDNVNMNTFVSVKDMNDSSETIFQNSQYRDLIQLIQYQREKITSQQADLTKVTCHLIESQFNEISSFLFYPPHFTVRCRNRLFGK